MEDEVWYRAPSTGEVIGVTFYANPKVETDVVRMAGDDEKETGQTSGKSDG